jgi:mono/diheme cytochrome c family protein
MTTAARVLRPVVLSAVMAGSAQAQGVSWNIPQDAVALKSPPSAAAAAMKTGRSIFASRCAKCHGADGRGSGPSSDPKHPAANLTDPSRAEPNPDGVLFYKIWNGGAPMPAFKSSLEKDEVWAVVEYVKTLRTP